MLFSIGSVPRTQFKKYLRYQVEVLDFMKYHGSSIADQIQAGIVVCPKTRQQLRFSGGILLGNGTRYNLLDQVPILLGDPQEVAKYANTSPVMTQEYGTKRTSISQQLRRWLRKGTQTEASRTALASVMERAEGVCLSIGGGPLRHHPKLTNLNIGPFPNVDIVGDAHELPYANESVSAIHSEAVFEHLRDPNKAAAELARILKPGGRAYVATPFLQAYHGYPHHYQNFTITGHALLFERVGLIVIDKGVQVGPTYAILALISVYLRTYLPKPVRGVGLMFWAPFILLLKPLDKLIGTKGHIMACTTYVVVEKPVTV